MVGRRTPPCLAKPAEFVVLVDVFWVNPPRGRQIGSDRGVRIRSAGGNIGHWDHWIKEGAKNDARRRARAFAEPPGSSAIIHGTSRIAACSPLHRVRRTLLGPLAPQHNAT